jgi:anhydro-N-acetylmuramic acid kinase
MDAAWYVGLMSGTSFDGIDVGLIRTDGEGVVEPGPALTLPHGETRRRRLAAVMGQREAPRDLVEDLTDAHGEAVERLIAEAGISPRDIRAVGFHGQTILHRPAEGLTVQIGDGERLAARLGIDVVEQFRLADVAAGGEGAPLAPVYHVALFGREAAPVAVVNIGGVANVTFSDGVEVIAYDAGPGNARIDDLMQARAGMAYDPEGRHGLAGKADEALVAAVLGQPFFQRRPPRSLDRDDVAVPGLDALSLDDAAATLAAVTADAIATSARFLPAPPRRWIVCGGGRRNGAIMARLAAGVAGEVVAAEAVGADGDGLEAHLFGYLAARSLAGLPLSFPGTTGVPRPTTGGVLRPAPR